MLKIIHISDIHIGAKLAFLGEKANLHRERIWKSLEKAIDIAVEKKVDLAVFSGDTFDHFLPSAVNIERFRQLLEKLTAQGTYVFILPGNHDRLEPRSVWAEFVTDAGGRVFISGKDNNGTGVISQVYSDLGLEVVSMPITQQKSKSAPLKMIAEFLKQKPKATKHRIVVAHGSLDIDGKGANYPISQAEIKALAEHSVEYIALGDWHGNMKVSDKPIPTYYSGSPEPLALDQQGAGKVVYIELSESQNATESGQAKVELISVSATKIEIKELNLEQIPPEQVIKEVSISADPNKILIMNLTGKKNKDAQLDIEEIEAQLGSKFYFLKINDKCDFDLNSYNYSDYPQGSIPGEFIKLVQSQVAAQKIPAAMAEKVIRLGLNTLTTKK